MIKKLQDIIDKHNVLNEQMADPNIFNNQQKLTEIAKEHSAMEDVVRVGKDYISVLKNIDDDKNAD